MFKNSIKILFVLIFLILVLTGCGNTSNNSVNNNQTIEHIDNLDNEIINDVKEPDNVNTVQQNVVVSNPQKSEETDIDLKELQKNREKLLAEEKALLEKQEKEKEKAERVTNLINDLTTNFKDINILNTNNISNAVIGKWKLLNSNEKIYNSEYNFIELSSEYNVNLGNISKGVFSVSNNSLIVTAQAQPFIDKLYGNVNEDEVATYTTYNFLVKSYDKYIQVTDVSHSITYYLEKV